jgi:NAD(P)H-dependent flavin oxidoreductase YrpB (nitropropane dioxygenase family)
MTGQPVQVVAAGGLFNGNSLAAALMLGASGVWIGTRFILADEAGAPVAHQEAVRTAGFEDNVRTIIFTVSSHAECKSGYGQANMYQGRPMRVRMNAYIQNWEENRREEMKELTSKGIIPVEHDFENLGDDVDDETLDNARPYLMGKVSAVVSEKKPAKAIVDEIVSDAAALLKMGNRMVAKL